MNPMSNQSFNGPTGSPSKIKKDIIPKGYRKGEIQNYTPQQQELHERSFQHVAPDSYLSRLAGGDEDIFNEIEAPAMREFQGMQGQMASRFSQGQGSGSLGQRRSSGFQNQMSAASGNLAQNLASQRHQLKRQAIQDLMGITGELLNQKPREKFLAEKPPKQQKPGWGATTGKLLGGIPGTVAALGSGEGWGGVKDAWSGAASNFNAGSLSG